MKRLTGLALSIVPILIVCAFGCGGAAAPAPAAPAPAPDPAAQPAGHAGHAGHTPEAPAGAPAPAEGDHAGHAAGQHADHGGHAGHGAGQHAGHGTGQHAGHGGHAGQHADHRGGGGMQHDFKGAERWAKVFDDPARDEWQQPDRVIAALGLTKKMVVADIGAGTGYFAVRLARAVPEGQVIATDLEPDMVRYLTERARKEKLANLRAIASPADAPGLEKASVDRVLVVDVWHHLSDRTAYARKLAEALRPGGAIAVVDFKLDAKRGPARAHRLPPEAIIADLRAAGLKAELSATDLPDQYIVLARR